MMATTATAPATKAATVRTQAIRSEKFEIGGGEAATRRTLQMMAGIVRHYKATLPVRMAALALVRGLPPKDYAAEARALFAYVRDRIRYTRDVHGVETLQAPDKTLEFGQGDCDDKAVLLASLAESIGFRTRFVAVAYQPRQFSHVYLELNIRGRWIPAETTEPWAFGRAVPPALRYMVVDAGSGSVALHGILGDVFHAVKNTIVLPTRAALHVTKHVAHEVGQHPLESVAIAAMLVTGQYLLAAKVAAGTAAAGSSSPVARLAGATFASTGSVPATASDPLFLDYVKPVAQLYAAKQGFDMNDKIQRAQLDAALRAQHGAYVDQVGDQATVNLGLPSDMARAQYRRGRIRSVVRKWAPAGIAGVGILGLLL